ncbi:hypothetical protein BDR03DRAFT_959170 [Suillus americanus]|nr:hypothetical protein BDR03DRAFT_959170 [Suillus americanus]
MHFFATSLDCKSWTPITQRTVKFLQEFYLSCSLMLTTSGPGHCFIYLILVPRQKASSKY